MVRNRTIHYGMILSAVVWCWLLADMGANASAAEAVCAVVKIEIRQELTLERQAFDAHMKITNGLTSLPLEDVKVTVTFADEEGNTVLASSETTEQEDVAFFIRPDSEGITKGSDGGWDIDDVAPVSEADLHWLIIPTPGSADAQPQGKLYYVGARLSYTLGGQTHVTEVTPDYIYVKPLPQMVLDYFLTRNVYGDDAWTSENESPVPFTLGVRVQNIGHNTAHDLKIDSAQPEIVENEQGLLIGFEITGSQVNGEPAEKSLLVDFGDLAPDATAVARWIMTCTLSGEFTDFTANISHADELGGELTSIIKQDNVHTHLLVKDVLVDLPGRDKIHDFLTVDAAFYKVFESNGTETETTDLSADTTWELHQETATRYTCDVSTPASAGFVYLSFPDPDHPQNQQAQLEELIRQDKLIEVIRSDGKRIKPANAWRSQQRKADPKDGWHYFVNLFDTSSTGSYTFVFDDVTSHNSPPALLPLSDQATAEGQELSFAVSATDPDGTIPEISAVNLPVGADLEEQSDGSAKFTWTPAIGQAGDYDLTFRASDGELSDSQAVTVTVYPHNDTDGDGLDDAWERQYFGNLDRDGTGDYDGDGISDRDEFLLGLDPTRTDHAPTIPGLADPAFGGQVDTLSPTLTIINSHDADGVEIF
ncbi:MAG: Ig-like domain-containing protein, partial [Desulfosudaceae bacterium]